MRYQVEYFVNIDGGCDLEYEINEWFRTHPKAIPINISINENCHQAMLLYKEE